MKYNDEFENILKRMKENSDMKLIPLKDCVKGRVYKLNCRNLSHGVYDGECEFIGIRTKFGSRYLFGELHQDASDFFGTVAGMVDTGINVPNDIELEENKPTIDKDTKRLVYFDGMASKGGRGWVFKDTNDPDININPVSHINRKLFKFLDNIEKSK